MQTSELVIYQKYVDLIYYTNNLLKKFPKCERHLIVSQITRTLFEVQEIILLAEKDTTLSSKIKSLNRIDVKLKMLKSYIRISFKSKYISINNYETWANKVTDISNMLGGWIKSCQKR